MLGQSHLCAVLYVTVLLATLMVQVEQLYERYCLLLACVFENKLSNYSYSYEC